jgi:hypothetical protein
VQIIHSSAHANHRLATKITTQIGGSAIAIADKRLPLSVTDS